MNCPICFSPLSEPVQELFALPSVASDCRPWSKGRSVQICSGCGVMQRVTNEDFNPDVYQEYASYPEPTGRTAKILEFVKDKMPEPDSILDIGCGYGHGIGIMKLQYPNSKIFGYEPTVHFERPSYRKYDLITLFHVFEHVEDLHEMLAYIKSSLTENGHLLIQVPYAVMWPFDLVIADHEWHFTIKSLRRLLGDAGFSVQYSGNEPIKKEITILATVGEPIRFHKIVDCLDTAECTKAIDWLLSFKSKLNSINEPVAVYGTSVSAMWTGNILAEKVMYYLDDDVNRLMTKFNGRNVHSPNWPKMSLPVVAPFPDWQLPEIKAKHPQLRFL